MTPLLTVGIPAYNRPDSLERAIRSVLAQTLADIEVVISDDASPDPRVAEVGKRFAQDDARVRFHRQPRNLGHVANFRWVLKAAHGRHFMWLSDDDWIDPDYAERCVSVLAADPSTRLVCGRARYYADDGHPINERMTNLTGSRPGLRLLSYYASVNMNGPLFGVTLRSDLREIPFREQVAGDWLLVAGLAARGRVRTLADVRLHRSAAGLGGRPVELARSFGITGPVVHLPHVLVAWYVWRDLAAQRGVPLPGRLATATVAALLVLLRFPAVQVLRRLGFAPIEERLVARAQQARN